MSEKKDVYGCCLTKGRLWQMSIVTYTVSASCFS